MALVDKHSITTLSKALCEKKISAKEVADDALNTIEKRNATINAFIQVTSDLAYSAATAVDKKIANGEKLSALAGIPVAFKDNFMMEGTKTTCASKMLENYESVYTATAVQAMLDEGVIPLGKLNMDELAFGSSTETSYFGKTRNPRDTNRVPGGSSGGSAAAVASGMVLAALGSDTGGSIRQPGSFCGTVSFKPSYGTVSRHGVVAFASSLDQVGPFARSVKDIAYVMDAICKKDPLDATNRGHEPNFVESLENEAKDFKVGFMPSLFDTEGVSDEVRTKFFEARDELEKAGATIVEINLEYLADALSTYYIIGPAEAYSNLSCLDSVRYGYRSQDANTIDELQSFSRGEGFGDEVLRRILLGAHFLSDENYDTFFVPATKLRTLIRKDFNSAFDTVDTIFMPTSPRTAFEFGEKSSPEEMYLSDIFTVPINIAGVGGINVPLGLGSDSNLPVGGQLLCRNGNDANLLRYAQVLESIYGSLPSAFADDADNTLEVE